MKGSNLINPCGCPQDSEQDELPMQNAVAHHLDDQNAKATPKLAPPEPYLRYTRQRRLDQVRRYLPSVTKLFVAAYAGKCSPRQAIKAFCLECMGLDKEDVKGCNAPACPLFEYRPYQTRKRQQHEA